jgi:uncharacterized protein
MQQPESKQLPWHERQWQIGTVGGLRAPGKATGFIEHGSSADGTSLQSAVHVLVGPQEGPVLYVQAAIHGDEVNGVEVLRRLLLELDPISLRGVLIVVPVANGPGFIHHRRRNGFDEEDMNRVWPGKEHGSMSQQIAFHLYHHAIRHADYVVDLHTASSNTLLHVVYAQGDERSRKLAEVFGIEVLLEEAIDDDLRRSRFTGKLRNVLTERGVPAITPELGGANCLEEEPIVRGVRGMTNVMKHLGMLNGEVVPPEQPHVTLRGSHLDEVWAQQGGIWIAQVKAGERVQQGQRLGSLYSVRTFETVEWVTAPYDGYILGLTDTPVINTGDGLVNICRLGE